jgi:serine phosphatase RsbU (regulator of sigma subunit)/anti-sigma regulatory factor (Ser/Thr protein kinase)
MIQRLLSSFFGPTIWLSGRLSFSRKYLLIGGVMLLAMAALSVPLLRQARESNQLAHLEREGLKEFVQQTRTLSALVALRSQAVSGQPGKVNMTPDELASSITRLVERAHQLGIADNAQRLASNWEHAGSLGLQEDPQLRFAALTGSINALLSLILESARSHRLNVDPELDQAVDMLTNRLPLILETLAKQQDAVALKSGVMASYALGAQVVLSESVPGLKAGIAQLAQARPADNTLQQALSRLLTQITRQQDAADKALNDEPGAIDELRAVAQANGEFARVLLTDAVATADIYLLERINKQQRAQWTIAALLVVAISAIAYLFAGIYMSTLRSLKSLSQGTEAFCSGRLDTRIKLDTQDELVLVARNFNTVAAEFGRLMEVIREQSESRQRELETLVQARTAELAEKNEQLSAVAARVQEEINLARNVQLAILPQQFPNEATWSVHASMFPARDLGGDFYDCFALPNGRYGILVADVSGKGVGAAFFMAVSRTVLLDQALSARSPATVLARANELLCERNPMELFVTACYGVYDPQDGSLVYANAGHHPPLLRRLAGGVEALPCSRDIALGLVSDMDYTNHTATLAAGDTLLLYTDGVTEAFSTHNEAYGDARLLAWLAASKPAAGASGLVDSLVKDVEIFVNGAEASDDLTCLVLCRKIGDSSLDTSPIELQGKTLLLDHKMRSQLEEIGKLAELVEGVLPDRPDLAFSANLCLEELITNTIQHGLGGRSDGQIHVRISITEEWLEIILKDDAPAYDPFAAAPVPDLGLAVESRPVGGLGVHLVKTLMDDARAYYDGSGNLIVLLKTLRK